jgi:hypothetical protein
VAQSRASSSYLLSCLTGQVLKDGVLSSFHYCSRPKRYLESAVLIGSRSRLGVVQFAPPLLGANNA